MKRGSYFMGRRERLMQLLFLLSALASVLAVGLICVFLFAGGLPAIGKIGWRQFLLGQTWKPGSDLYGILPMIVGSLSVTAGAVMLGVPIGVLTAVFLARFCPPPLYRLLKPAVDLLAGIPSIVYGFFGLMVLVPFVRSHIGGDGNSILTASILLAVMILPSVITVSESALGAVPDSYYQGGLALGASHEHSIFFAVLPAAKAGIMAAVLLGVGRAMGETMAVMMVVGNQARMPEGVLDGVRPLTTNIIMEMGYAADLHREALIATAMVLFVLVLLIHAAFWLVRGRDG